MRVLRLTLSIFFLLVLVLALAITALFLLVDPNEMRPVIQKEIKRQTGYEAIIEGNLHWAIYPLFSIKIKNLQLISPENKVIFLSLSNLKISTDPLKLIYGEKQLSGNLSVDSIKLENIVFNQARVMLHWANGVLTLDPISAQVYDGYLSGKLTENLAASTPSLNFSLKVSDIATDKLLRAVNPQSKIIIKGLANANLTAASQGKSPEEIKQHLSGTFDFALTKGVIEGVDFNYYIQSAQALIAKQDLPAKPEQNNTPFESLTLNGVISEGIVSSNNLLLSAETFKTLGEGKLNLNNNKLDLKLNIAPTYANNSMVRIPLVVKGLVNNPEIGLDMNEINKIIMQAGVQELKTQAIQELNKRYPGKGADFLQTLLGH